MKLFFHSLVSLIITFAVLCDRSNGECSCDPFTWHLCRPWHCPSGIGKRTWQEGIVKRNTQNLVRFNSDYSYNDAVNVYKIPLRPQQYQGLLRRLYSLPTNSL